MDPTEVIRRYLFLGTDQPFYIRKNKPLDVQDGLRILAPIKALADHLKTPNEKKAVHFKEMPLNIVENALKSGVLARHDECLFALAYMLRTFKPSDRDHFYKAVPVLIESSKDLFQFVHFYMLFAPEKADEDDAPDGEPKKKNDDEPEKQCGDTPDVDMADDEPKKENDDTPDVDMSPDAPDGVPAAEPTDKPKKITRSFGKKIKQALRNWYNKFSAEDLAKMLISDRGWYGWCHKDILKMAHLKVQDVAKMQVIDAACGGPGVTPYPEDVKKNRHKKIATSKRSEKIRKWKANQREVTTDEHKIKPSGSETEEASTSGAAKMEVSDADSDSKDTTKPTESSTEGETSEADLPVHPENEALKMFKRMKEFKSQKTFSDAVAAIEKYHYSLQLVPAKLQRSANVWESLLPNMSYREIVQAALVLQDYKLFKETNTSLIKTYGSKINCQTVVQSSQISPIFIYQVMRLFEERQRYLCAVKEAIHTSNNLALRNTKANPMVMNQLYSALNFSLHNFPKIENEACKFLVTLDLRSKQSKKRVFNNRLMSCQAAYVLLTLPLHKRGKVLKVLSFTGDSSELTEVDFPREKEFFSVCDEIQNLAREKKTVVDITQPFKHATKEKLKVDVFLTIVDSLIRVNPTRAPPVAELKRYNEAMKANARYIIVSLSRHTQDLDKTMKLTDGVLEMVGCSEETPKLIAAYADKRFM